MALSLTTLATDERHKESSTFVDNMKLPVHRWFRYSAGFSAEWVRKEVADSPSKFVRVFDPFAGSGTTLLAAQDAGAESAGVESHPFVYRVAKAKLARTTDPDTYKTFAESILRRSRKSVAADLGAYPPLIAKCYSPESLNALDRIRRSLAAVQDESPQSALAWLTLISILRKTSHVGTANWQYVLPNKSKRGAVEPFKAFQDQIDLIYRDMLSTPPTLPAATLVQTDARVCEGIPDAYATLVITSPPYPNNFDYADATRLEMSFMQEIAGWGDLQDTVRQHLVRSCSQHVTGNSVDLDATLSHSALGPISDDIRRVCEELGVVRLSKGGKKAYHLMIACYFLDLAKVWQALRRVCATPSKICFVIGDSAPYGVHVPVMDWMGRLAIAAGFHSCDFTRLRDRNIKWKNRKHRVPLCEGRLWVRG